MPQASASSGDVGECNGRVDMTSDRDCVRDERSTVSSQRQTTQRDSKLN